MRRDLVAVLMLFACSPVSAQANVPSPRSKAMPIIVTQSSKSVGQLNFDVAYADGVAKGTASASQLKLTNGRQYLLRTCVWAKAQGLRPESQCRSKTITIDLLTAVSGVSALTTSLTVARPGAGQSPATIAGTVLIDEVQTGRWNAYASSWPADGLPSAGLPVPAVEHTDGTVLPSQGTRIPGVRAGGIDSGAPDSICQGDDLPATTAPRGSTDALGSLAAPYEMLEATGRTRGTMILLHGGSWQLHGRGALESMRADADRWRARGWRTVNASYRPCGASIDDVISLYDRVRQTYGAKRPICALGWSAGAHLALLLASLRPTVACVVSQAGPADLVSWSSQGSPVNTYPILLSNITVSAFGADRLKQSSPRSLGVEARVLYAVAAGDIAVPWAQATAFVKSQRARSRNLYVDALRLSTGAQTWIHVSVSGKALSAFYAHENRLVKPLINGAINGPPRIALSVLRRRGLSVRYTCPTRCHVSARLTRGANTLGTRRTRRSRFATGSLTIRLSSRGRKQAKRETLRLAGAMRVDGKTHRFSSRIVAR